MKSSIISYICLLKGIDTLSFELKDNETLRQALSRFKKELKTDPNLPVDVRDITEALASDDAKTRKNAALLLLDLKKLGRTECENDIIEALFNSYKNEAILFVRPCILESMAGFKANVPDDIKEALEERLKVIDETKWEVSDEKHIKAERHELLMILSDESDDAKQVKSFAHPFEILLTCDKLFAEQIATDLGSGSKVTPNGVRAKVSKLDKILKNRLFKELLFLVPIKKGYICNRDTLAELAKNTAILRLLDDLYQDEEKSNTYRFRLNIESGNEAFSDGKYLKKVAAEIEADSKGRLINDPGNYDLIIVCKEKKDGNLSLYVEIPSIDNRFAYRIHTEPTSMSTHMAAETIHEIKEFIKPESWILDPFCGTATLLLERALEMPSREYYGIDTFGQAIAEARENADAAGVKINFINRDFFDFTSDYPFHEILAEFPDFFGKEPKEKDEFFTSFFKKAVEVAADEALMFLITDEENLIKKHIRLAPELKLVRSKSLGKSKQIYIIGVEK